MTYEPTTFYEKNAMALALEERGDVRVHMEHVPHTQEQHGEMYVPDMYGDASRSGDHLY